MTKNLENVTKPGILGCMASIQARKNADGKITSYRVRWRVDGRMDTISCETEEQAVLWKKMLEANNGSYDRAESAILQAADKSPNLSDVIEKYLVNKDAEDDVTAYTMRKYRQIARTHIAPVLGDIPVAALDKLDVTRLMREMRDVKGSSPKTIRNMLGLLVPAIDYAVARGWRTGNPAAGRKVKDRRAGGSPDMAFLTLEEFRVLLSHVDEFFHPFLTLLFTTGLRFSEATALTPEDFITDPHGGLSVRVSKAYKDDGENGVYLGDPKTPKARRTVGIPPSAVPMLSAHLEDVAPGAHVFTMKRGGLILNRRLHNRVWQPALTKAAAHGFPKRPSIHSLRHSYASLMLAGGLDIPKLSAAMGHESVQTTLNVYSHLLPSYRFEMTTAATAAFPALTS